MKVYLAVAVVLFLLPVAGCAKSEKWESAVYPDRANLLMRRSLGPFATLDDCKDASMSLLAAEEALERGYFICGRNCSNPQDMICEETYKGNLYR